MTHFVSQITGIGASYIQSGSFIQLVQMTVKSIRYIFFGYSTAFDSVPRLLPHREVVPIGCHAYTFIV